MWSTYYDITSDIGMIFLKNVDITCANVLSNINSLYKYQFCDYNFAQSRLSIIRKESEYKINFTHKDQEL